jgi:hypothetical protein
MTGAGALKACLDAEVAHGKTSLDSAGVAAKQVEHEAATIVMRRRETGESDSESSCKSSCDTRAAGQSCVCERKKTRGAHACDSSTLKK